jgi:hypothetical protein
MVSVFRYGNLNTIFQIYRMASVYSIVKEGSFVNSEVVTEVMAAYGAWGNISGFKDMAE